MAEIAVQFPFEQRFNSFSTGLKTGIDQRDAGEVSLSLSYLRKIAVHITPELFTSVAQGSPFGRQLLEAGPDASIATREEDLVLVAIFSLLLYRQNAWDRCQQLLHRQLFDLSGELVQHEHLEPLTAYLFQKYLLCVERGSKFASHSDQLFFMLKRLQLVRADQLYATLLVFSLRWMVQKRQFSRMAALLRQTDLPHAASATLQAKYFFYKGLFAEATGQFASALDSIEQASRKAPERAREGRGYQRFRLLLSKHLIVLGLMLSRGLPPFALRFPELRPYVRLATLVSRGENREFEAFIAQRASYFSTDLVMPVLNRMQGVVLQNALKKLASAYTGISADEVLRRLGVDPGAGFDLTAFFAKSRDVIEHFKYDVARKEVRFEPAPECFSDAVLQEKTLDRLRRVEMLSEQLRRGLRYAPRQHENGERTEVEPDFEELDLEGIEFDDLDFDD